MALLTPALPPVAASTCAVGDGFDLFETSPTKTVLGDRGVLELQHFHGIPIGSYDFGDRGGVQDTGSTDTIVHHTVATSGQPVSAVRLLKLQLQGVENPNLFVTLQSDRGVNLLDPPVGPPSLGTLALSFNAGCTGTFDSLINVNFDVRLGALDGQIVASGDLVLTTQEMPWDHGAGLALGPSAGMKCMTHSEAGDPLSQLILAAHGICGPSVALAGVNKFIGGVDGAYDFFPGKDGTYFASSDLSLTYYHQEPGFADMERPGVGFLGVTDPDSACIVAWAGGQVFPPAESDLAYHNQARIYLNLKAGFKTIPGPGAIGPAFQCPRNLVVAGALDPGGYQLFISGMDVAATVDKIHLSEVPGALGFSDTGVVTSTDWEIGVCPWASALFTKTTINDPEGYFSQLTGPLSNPLNQVTGSSRIWCGYGNNAWTAVRDATPALDSSITGNVLVDEVDQGPDPVYFVSCVTSNVAWSATNPPSIGTRTASSHDWALVLPTQISSIANIGAAILHHLVGSNPPMTLGQGLYDLNGDNGTPCDAAGAPAKTALLVKS
ncbi:MAG TPA: hypothetical protein VM241_07560 [Candidatus Thermoplasmatota archaeon]|nr:hypothetical protein [Candidatus Thermoplasmatota archaeon]